MYTVSHHGRTTAYRSVDRDDARTLLAVHGSGGSRRVWTPQSRLADHRVVALDLSGHGDSDDVTAAPGYETLSAYVDDVVAVAEAVDADALAGHSLGGAVVLTALAERALDVSGVVVVGTGVRLPISEDLLAFATTDLDQAIAYLHEPDRLFHGTDDDAHDVSRASLRDAGRATLERDLRTAHAVDLQEKLVGVDAPALAIAGEYDRFAPPYYAGRLREELPDCETGVIDDAAHLAMLDAPEAFGRAVGPFLART